MTHQEVPMEQQYGLDITHRTDLVRISTIVSNRVMEEYSTWLSQNCL